LTSRLKYVNKKLIQLLLFRRINKSNVSRSPTIHPRPWNSKLLQTSQIKSSCAFRITKQN